MKVLVTGAAGFLGRGLVLPFEGVHDLRLMDVTGFDWIGTWPALAAFASETGMSASVASLRTLRWATSKITFSGPFSRTRLRFFFGQQYRVKTESQSKQYDE